MARAHAQLQTEVSRLQRYIWFFAGCWTLVFGGIILYTLLHERDDVRDVVRLEAQSFHQKNILDEHQRTSDGMIVVQLDDGLTVYGHITSLHLSRQTSAPNTWETAALNAFAHGETEVSEIVDRPAGTYMQIMKPLITEERCLQCHGAQGYKVGDIRGGLRIDVPINPMLKLAQQQAERTSIYFALLWVFGCAGIVMVGKKIVNSARAHAETLSLLRTLMDALPDAIYFKDKEGRYIVNNASHVHTLGKQTMEEVEGKTVFDVHPLNLASKYHEDEQKIVRTGEPLLNMEEQYINRETNETRWHATSKVPMRDSSGAVVGIVGISRDVTEKKRMEEERERLIGDLIKAVTDIKTLSGLIPICSSCKKIRGDEGYWTQIEKYLQDHSEARFSHGICPDCASSLYPKYYSKLAVSGEHCLKTDEPEPGK